MSDYEEEEPQGLILRTKQTVLLPLRILSSKPAQRAYLTSFLFAGTCLFLLVVSITAYILFYWTYIPRIGFNRPVHLQFDGVDSHPWGTANLVPDLVSLQPYDVSVILRVPRTKTNTDMGNFMLETAMFAPGDKGSVIDTNILPSVRDYDSLKVLASSRRSAILTYYSPIVDLMRKATELHWFILGWRLEAETLEVPVFEAVSFAKGWRNVPATLQLQVQSPARMQIYDAKVIFKARFRGLRWLMYNYRITSAVIFITAFWGTEVVFTAICWALLSFIIFSDSTPAMKSEESETKRIKDEPASGTESPTNLSDTERTFPTYGSKTPSLRYQSPFIKKEETESEPFPPLFATTAEADDEDEDADFLLTDSGLGTSMESSSGSVRKRNSKNSGGSRG